jgi:hypothetical protein
MTALVALAMVPLSISPTSAAPPSIVVNTDTDGGVVADADCTLTEAVRVALGDSTAAATGCAAPKGKVPKITFDAAILPATITMTNAPGGGNRFQIDGPVNIEGPGADQLILDSDGFRAFDLVSGAALTASGIRMRNGGSGGSGGAIQARGGSSLDLSDCVLDNNQNSSLSGGAVAVRGGATATIDNCIFFDNLAASGGGAIAVIANANGAATLTVKNSTFFGNHAPITGGAIQSSASPGFDAIVVIEDSLFINNTTGNVGFHPGGGAIFATANLAGANASTTVTRTFVGGNWARLSAGGIHGHATNGATVTVNVVDSTVVGNTSDDGPATGQDITASEDGPPSVSALNVSGTFVDDCVNSGFGTGCP